jgi:hemolysin activation/secretion protein
MRRAYPVGRWVGRTKMKLRGLLGVMVIGTMTQSLAQSPAQLPAAGATKPPTSPAPATEPAAPATAPAKTESAAPGKTDGSAAPKPGSPAAAKAQPAKPFAILEYRIEGNTLLPAIEIERAVTPFLGENKTLKDIEGAKAQLERTYHSHGYKTALVNIPPQQVSEGIVRLVVTEAAVGKLHITGSRYHSLEIIRQKMAQLTPGTVPDFAEVQKELGEVNRSADLRVTPILRASETPGHVDVELNVKDELPLHWILETNNRYSSNTTHPRVISELRYDNLFQRNQSFSLQFQLAPVRISDAKIWSFSYVIPTSSLVWALYAVHSDSNVAAVGNLNVIGKGNIYGLRMIDPLPTESRDFSHTFTAGIDFKDFGQTVVLQGATDTVDSPVKYAPFVLDYSASWFGAIPDEKKRHAATPGSRSSTTLDLSVNFLVQGLGSDWHRFNAKRAGAGGSYLFFHPSVSREQVIPGQWTVAARIDGQLASGPLINNEQFSAGGADSVRGYTESERLGDDGVHASLEIRTPHLLTHAYDEMSYVFVFADAAKLWIQQPLPSQEARFTLASAGLGMRFKAAGLTVALDGARILRDGYATKSGRYRGLFKVSYSY